MNDSEKGKGDGPPDPSTAIHSQSTDSDGSIYRDSVYKFCTASSKAVEPHQLINILKSSIGGGALDGLNTRMSNVEVMMTKILNAITDNKAENRVSSNVCLSRIENCEEKINLISETVPKIVNLFANGLDQFQASIQMAIDTFEDRMMSVERLQLHHLLKNNAREQRSRAWSVKIHGYVDYSVSLPDVDQDLEDEASTGSVNSGVRPRKIFGEEEVKIFKKLLLPALKKALEKGELRFLPSEMDQIIEVAHKSGGAPGQPPSYLFRFFSRPVLYAMLRNKSDPLNALNKANMEANPSLKDRITNGSYREVRIGCDLTSLNRSILTFLHRQSEVHFAKVSGDKLIFQLHNEPNRWRTVLNPFSATLSGLSQPPADINHFVNSIFIDPPPYLQDQRSKDGQQLANNEDTEDSGAHPCNFLSNHSKNKSRLSKAVASMKKNFDSELALFTKEISAVKEAQVTAMETTASLMEDLSAALSTNRKEDNSEAETEDSMESDSTTSVVPAEKHTDTASIQVVDDITEHEMRVHGNRERSTSTKRPIQSPNKPRSNKKPRKSNRKRQ